MREGWKKVVSAMLCAAMVVSMSGLAVSADGENNDLTGNNLTKGEEGSDDLTNGEEDGDDLTNGEDGSDLNNDKEDGDDLANNEGGGNGPAGNDGDGNDLTNNEEGGNGPAGNDGDGSDLTNGEEGGNGGEDGSEEKTPNNLPPTGPNRIMPLGESPTIVNSFEDLQKALADSSVSEIIIDGEIAVTGPITITRSVKIGGTGILKDSITTTTPAPNFITVSGDGLTVDFSGITIESGSNTKYAIQYYLSNGTMSNVTVHHENSHYTPVLINGADVTIESCTMTTGSYALIELAKGQNVNDIPSVNITGVSETTTPLLYADGKQIKVSELQNKIIVDGEKPTLQVNGTSIIVSKLESAQTGVAETKGAIYATLQEAIANVEPGGTITILKDVPNAVGLSVPGGKNFTIDFDKHTYTLVGPGAGSTNTETNAFQFLQGSTITLKNGTIRISKGANNIKRIIQNYADLTLENMQIYAQNQVDGENYPLSFNNGQITFKGNTSVYTSAPESTIAFDVCKYSSYPSTKVTFDDNYTGTIQGIIMYDSPDHTTHTLTINGNGHFGKVDYTAGNEESARKGIEISGGTFTESVDEYVIESLNYELNSNGLYSYYSTLEEAKQAAGTTGGTIIARDTNAVTIIPPTTPDTNRPSGNHSTGNSSSSSSSSSNSGSHSLTPEQSKQQAIDAMWKRAINKINAAKEGSRLKIYMGINEEIPDYVLAALRENNVTVTFYNQDGEEVTIPAGMAPRSLRSSWTLKQLGNYVLGLDAQGTETEEAEQATQESQPAAEQATAGAETGKPNPETGDASAAMMAIAAAAASLCGVVLLSNKKK